MAVHAGAARHAPLALVEVARGAARAAHHEPQGVQHVGGVRPARRRAAAGHPREAREGGEGERRLDAEPAGSALDLGEVVEPAADRGDLLGDDVREGGRFLEERGPQGRGRRERAGEGGALEEGASVEHAS